MALFDHVKEGDVIEVRHMQTGDFYIGKLISKDGTVIILESKQPVPADYGTEPFQKLVTMAMLIDDVDIVSLVQIVP